VPVYAPPDEAPEWLYPKSPPPEGLLCCGQSVKGNRGWSCNTHRSTAHQPSNHSSKTATARRLVAVALIATTVVVIVIVSAVTTAAATTQQSTERAESAA
jgi:nicotinamide riboside transporter PnuC